MPKQVNAVTHTINPWPRNVGDRRIAYDARRVGAAVTRYSNTTQPVDQLPDIGPATKAMGQRPPSPRTRILTYSGSGAGSSWSIGAGRRGGNSQRSRTRAEAAVTIDELVSLRIAWLRAVEVATLSWTAPCYWLRVKLLVTVSSTVTG